MRFSGYRSNTRNNSNLSGSSPPRSVTSSHASLFSVISLGDSGHFVTGDYEHNLEILDNWEAEESSDFIEEDRLIYEATNKIATASDLLTSRNRMVVSSEELNREESNDEGDNDLFGAEESDSENPSPEKGSQKTNTREAVMKNLRLIFLDDNNYLEVSREEIQRVRVMHKRFLEDSSVSFNYNTLLILSSIIAALGLASDSTATIIASMLVSPLMGPVMDMAYGATILDFKLFLIALRTEIISLFACIVVGFVVGALMLPFVKVLEMYPTDEMTSRGKMENFYFGIPIAFASGMGVAVSVLDEQTASLVGVAISASLLPPAVNAGMLWVLCLYSVTSPKVTKKGEGLFNDGMISLALTLINILMIIISSMLMFRIKEVRVVLFVMGDMLSLDTHSLTLPCFEFFTQRVPIKKKKIFWTDLGLARKIYQNLAVYDSKEAAEMNPMKRMGHRMGHRVSNLIAGSQNFFNSPKNQNRKTMSRGLDLAPSGSEDTMENNDPKTSTNRCPLTPIIEVP